MPAQKAGPESGSAPFTATLPKEQATTMASAASLWTISREEGKTPDVTVAEAIAGTASATSAAARNPAPAVRRPTMRAPLFAAAVPTKTPPSPGFFRPRRPRRLKHAPGPPTSVASGHGQAQLEARPGPGPRL